LPASDFSPHLVTSVLPRNQIESQAAEITQLIFGRTLRRLQPSAAREDVRDTVQQGPFLLGDHLRMDAEPARQLRDRLLNHHRIMGMNESRRYAIYSDILANFAV
jgi:hypothetical protein